MGKNKINKENKDKNHLLLGIKKDEEEIKKYEKLLNIKKKKKYVIADLFSSLDAKFSDEEDKMEDDESEEDCGDIDECESDDEDQVESLDEEMEDIEEEEVDNTVVVKPPTKLNNNEVVNDLHIKIKRSILQHLNKLCEAQMTKCLDGVEEIWNKFPRGDVRDVFIKESISYMKFSCMDLAVFVVCLHIRLSKYTNIVAFYTENVVERLSGFSHNQWENEGTLSTIMCLYKFISYITRLEIIDCNLIMDLMTEMCVSFQLPQLKVLAEVSSIIGFYVRKNSSVRCETMVGLLKEKMSVHLCGSGDMNELKSYSEAVVDKLTSSKAKSDVVFQSVEKYKKLMKKWCRNATLSETIALKLCDFRGDNRVRWWLVGSAVDPSVAHNKTSSQLNTNNNNNDSSVKKKFSAQEEEWNCTAKSLGLSTEGKQTLFRLLMAAKLREEEDDGDGAVESLLVRDIVKLTESASGGTVAVSEGDMVRVVVRCLSLETDYCQLYVGVLAALLESHRRFRQIVKCAIWDVLAQPRLVESVKRNCGRCVGQLVAMAGLPVNILKKFNFTDDSAANNIFMMSVMTEIFEENWSDIAEILRQMSTTISVKFVGNLRLFLKKNFKIDEHSQLSRATIFKVTKSIEVLQELRRTVN